MYIFYNTNPANKIVGDCVIRGLSILLQKRWDEVYDDLMYLGKQMCDMPSSNAVWSEYLYQHEYTRRIIPDTCPSCYTVRRFCDDHRNGAYLLATGSHVVAVIDGNYYDTWDSGDEIPVYYFKRRKYRK